MKNFLYKWLPRFFGCHCREDRSFKYKGRKFPICARCSGELAGIILGMFVSVFFVPQNFWFLLLAIPMILDGFVQKFTKYESNNIKRLLTGILFGYAFVTFIILTTGYAFKYGYDMGSKIRGI